MPDLFRLRDQVYFVVLCKFNMVSDVGMPCADLMFNTEL